MATRPDIDFGRAAVLMDTVHKITTVAPRHTALLGMAMEELNEMQGRAAEYLHIKGQEDLAASRDAAAKLNAQNALEAEKQEREQAIIRDRTYKAQTQAGDLKPITVMPGEPNPIPEIEARQEAAADTAPIARRTLENTNG